MKKLFYNYRKKPLWGKVYAYRENELFGDGEKPGRGEAHLGPRQLGHKQLQLGTTERETIRSNWIMVLSI